jgi:uncharacterized protein YkwD
MDPVIFKWVLFLVCLLVLAGCEPGGSALLESARATQAEVELEAEAVAKLNDERQRRGLPVLDVDERLAAAARAHSLDMADRGFFDHRGSDGSKAGERISDQGYRWRFYAENIACGQRSAEQLFADWMASQHHRANILSDNVERVGVGIVYREGSDCIYYWTAVFAAEY